MNPFPRLRAAGQPDLLSIADLGPQGIADVVEHALVLKSQAAAGIAISRPLAGKHAALLFDKPSLRTRVSFEVGVHRLGGSTTTMSAADVGLGSREPIGDIAQTLSRYVELIVARIHDHADLVALAAAADVPVINALSAWEHPCQALADLVTLQEHLGGLEGRTLAYVGDGNNVCHSLLLGGAAVGLHVKVATPAGYGPDASIVDEARVLAREHGGRVEVTHDPVAAVGGADAVYTDTWTSMGFEGEAMDRERAFAPFRVTHQLLVGAPDAIVMHCLPAHRGHEIDADVLDGPASVAFDQAENRLYAQQAAILQLLSRSRLWQAEPTRAAARVAIRS
jgi:ornithine carbamoyltransferase